MARTKQRIYTSVFVLGVLVSAGACDRDPAAATGAGGGSPNQQAGGATGSATGGTAGTAAGGAVEPAAGGAAGTAAGGAVGGAVGTSAGGGTGLGLGGNSAGPGGTGPDHSTGGTGPGDGQGGGAGGIMGTAGAGPGPGPECASLFPSQGQVPDGHGGASGIAIANLTGAGKRDLVVANPMALTTYSNDGTGHFTIRGTYDITSAATSDVTTGDLNGDGLDDVAVAHGRSLGNPPMPQPVSVFLNRGDGSMSETRYDLPAAGQTVWIADIDGDHQPDVVVYALSSTYLLPSQGAGAFGSPVALAVDTGPTAAADLDGDGLADLLVNVLSGIRVELNRGGLVFSPQPLVAPGIDAESFIPVDMNGDHAIDVVMLGRVPMVDQNQRTIAVALNDGHGTLSVAYTGKVPYGVAGLAVGDFDDDGRPDIAVSVVPDPGYSTGGLVLLRAASDGSYAGSSCSTDLFSGVFSSAPTLAAGDLNGDGRADLAVALRKGATLLFSPSP